jgi:GT2 family glycosyltransferase
MPELTVIVSTYNRGSRLRACLAPLAGQLAGVDAEIIVCDDGSNDESYQVVRSIQTGVEVYFVSQSHRGFRLAASRNMAVRLARGDLLLFVDADVVPRPGLVDRHLKAHRAGPGPCWVIGAVYGYGSGPAEDFRAPVWAGIDLDPARLTEPWTLVTGNNFSVPRQAVAEVGGFAEEFVGWGAEDVDLAWRLHGHGVTFRIEPDAGVAHRAHPLEPHARYTYFVNRRRIYHHRDGLAAELLPYYRVVTYSAVIDRIRELVAGRTCPDYAGGWSKADCVRLRELLRPPALLIGGGDCGPAIVEPFAAVTDPDPAKARRIRLRSPGKQVVCCAGANLSRLRGAFHSAVVTDFVRGLDLPVVYGILSEATERAGHVLLIDTPGFRIGDADTFDIGELARELADFERAHGIPDPAWHLRRAFSTESGSQVYVVERRSTHSGSSREGP